MLTLAITIHYQAYYLQVVIVSLEYPKYAGIYICQFLSPWSLKIMQYRGRLWNASAFHSLRGQLWFTDIGQCVYYQRSCKTWCQSHHDIVYSVIKHISMTRDHRLGRWQYPLKMTHHMSVWISINLHMLICWKSNIQSVPKRMQWKFRNLIVFTFRDNI